MKTRVLVTGAAGFLGSHLTDRLLAEGHAVIGVDNLSTGSLDNLAHLHNEPAFSFEQLDICEPFDVGSVGYVYNFASPASPPGYMRLGIETLRVGSIGTENALQVAVRSGAKFLHASTSECYGDPLEHPQSESYWGHVNPIGPRSVYDESKRYAEALVMAYNRYRGVDTHLVRIFNTYGPRLDPDDGRVISNFLMQGSARRAPRHLWRRPADPQLLLRQRPHRGHPAPGAHRRASPRQSRQPRRVHRP